MDLEELEAQAELKVTTALGRYSVAALTIGIVFAVLMLLFAMLIAPSSIIGGAFAVATAIVILWLVALLRAARAAIKATSS